MEILLGSSINAGSSTAMVLLRIMLEKKKKVLVVVAKSPEYDKWGYIDFRTNKLYIVVMIKCCENQQ